MSFAAPLRSLVTARLGAWLWVSSLQYFAAQIVTAGAWSTPYSLAGNYVSDLAATKCLVFDGNFVCSPWHALMNLSFVVLGLTMIAGAWLIPRFFTATRALRVGFWCIGLAGAGTMVVGFSPENVNLTIHQIGAFFPFGVGNLGMLVIGWVLMKGRQRLGLSVYSWVSGTIGLTAAVLYCLKVYAGLGVGGMERVATYPLAIWMIGFGAVCLMSAGRRDRRER